ncbi:MAG: hypothetical protein PUP90_07050 [Nostoc sp. S4]|nr:hypothetical protein [Nostoc sp. S4]
MNLYLYGWALQRSPVWRQVPVSWRLHLMHLPIVLKLDCERVFSWLLWYLFTYQVYVIMSLLERSPM